MAVGNVSLKEALAGDKMDIELVRTADGYCPKACYHCGAFPARGEKPSGLIDICGPRRPKDRIPRLKRTPLGRYNVGTVVSLTREEIAENLDKPVVGTKMKIFEALSPVITQDGNMDPLLDETFIYLAEEVYARRPGPIDEEEAQRLGVEVGSRAIWLSHGIDVDEELVPDPEQVRRAKKLVRLMHKGVCPGGVLTVDMQQYCGKSSEPQYYAGYLETLKILRPVLTRKSARITISIQGHDNRELEDGSPNPMYRGHAENMLQRILDELELTFDEREALSWNKGRPVVGAGRGRVFARPEDECPLIPDEHVVRNYLRHRLYRAGVAMDGRVYRQINDVGATYNSTVDPFGWEELDNNVAPEDVSNTVDGDVLDTLLNGDEIEPLELGMADTGEWPAVVVCDDDEASLKTVSGPVKTAMTRRGVSPQDGDGSFRTEEHDRRGSSGNDCKKKSDQWGLESPVEGDLVA